MSIPVMAFAAVGGDNLSVDASGVVGQTNINSDPGESYSGVRFLTDGTWETMNNNAVSSGQFSSPENSGTWLTSGDASDVWVQRSYTSGTFDTDPGSGRLQLSSNRTFEIDTVGDATEETQTVQVTFNFYDAASGGNLLDSTSTLTYNATRISGV